MIELHTWTTPNGIKPIILLEELEVPYQIRWVDLGKGEQHQPEHLRINPNGKIPPLIDDGVPIFESGAILIHLATFGWAGAMPRLEINPAPYPYVNRWLDRLRARPAVQRAQARKP